MLFTAGTYLLFICNNIENLDLVWVEYATVSEVI